MINSDIRVTPFSEMSIQRLVKMPEDEMAVGLGIEPGLNGAGGVPILLDARTLDEDGTALCASPD